MSMNNRGVAIIVRFAFVRVSGATFYLVGHRTRLLSRSLAIYEHSTMGHRCVGHKTLVNYTLIASQRLISCAWGVARPSTLHCLFLLVPCWVANGYIFRVCQLQFPLSLEKWLLAGGRAPTLPPVWFSFALPAPPPYLAVLETPF